MKINTYGRRKINIDKAKGMCCHDCGIYFKRGQGEPVICAECAKWRKFKGLPIEFPVTHEKIITMEDLAPDEIARILFNGKQREVNARKIKRYKEHPQDLH